MPFIVGIDGVAGSGKGTVTKILAKKHNLVNIDTGITYRCVAKAMLDNNVSLEDKEDIIKLSKEIKIEILNKNGEQVVLLNDIDVTKEIRSKEVTQIVSQASSIKEVRYNMVDVQRKMAEGKDIIMEGRDICTYVFPNADVKIYLDATVEERAKRRYKENQEKGIKMTYEEILENIKLRDYNDMHKEIGSLKIGPDSVVIDTTNLTIDEVVQKISDVIDKKRGK